MEANVRELSICDLDIAMVPSGCCRGPESLGKGERSEGLCLQGRRKAIDHLEERLTGCHLVSTPAGMPREPGMARDDLFNANADIENKGLVEACTKVSAAVRRLGREDPG